VSYNDIKNVPHELFDQLRRLRRLYIVGNPIPSQIVAQLNCRYKNVSIIFWELYPATNSYVASPS
jgi:hypothetical protein